MAELKPVDYDPFATTGPKLTPVDEDPFAGVKVTPVDEDPFGGTEPIDDSWLAVGRKVLENTPAIFTQVGAGIMQQAAEAPIPRVPGREAQQALAAELMGRSPEQTRAKSEYWAKTYADATADLQENAPDVDPDSLKGYAYDAATSLIQMLPAVAGTLLTKRPIVGASAMGAQVGGQKYGESRAAGRTPEQAQNDAIFTGLAEGVPEMLPLGLIMKPGKKFFGRVFSTAGAEGLSEMVTQVLQTGYDAGVLQEDMTWGEAVDAVKRAGIIGAVTGGGAGAIAHPFVRDTETAPAPPGADAAAAGTPSAEAGGRPSPPAAAATMPTGAPAPVSPPDTSIPDVGTRVGLRQAEGPPEAVQIEAVQDGYVIFRREDGSQDAAKEGDFRRDLTAAPPPKQPQQPDATTVPSPPKEGEPPPVETGDINDFNPYEIRQPARKPVAPSPQGAMALPETKQIQNLKDGARYLQQTAAEAERIRASGSKNARTAEDIASMRVEAARMLDEATALERRLTPARASQDPTAATAEQLAGQPLGPLGRAMPAASEATTGPREYPVTPPRAPQAPAQPALAPVARSEAEVPQEPQFRPQAPAVPWQQRLRQQIGQRKASLNDPVAMARNLGTTPEAVTAELQSIATGKNSPIEIMRGKVTIDPKTKQPVQSKRAGKWRYTPKPTGQATESLSDFIYNNGGMAAGSFAGELAARDLIDAGRPFKGKLIKPAARMNLEQMADHAQQSGFPIPLDATGQHADLDAFLNMLEQDHGGRRKFYVPGTEPQQEAPARPKTPTERKREATRRLTALGVEPRGTTVDELEAQLDAMLDAIGDATRIDTMDFARTTETETVNRMDEDAQDALRQEAGNDFPYEYDDAWLAAEIAEGVRPAQPATDAGVSPGAAEPQAEPGSEAAAGERAADTAEAAPEGGAEAGPQGLSAPAGGGQRVGVLRDLTDTVRRQVAKVATRAGKVKAIHDWVVRNGSGTGHEYGAAATPDGQILWAGTQDLPDSISFSNSLIAALMNPVGHIDIHHNHPAGGGPLSRQDMGVLGYPGAGWVIAYDRNGRFSAARMSDAFREATDRLTLQQRTELFNWAATNASAATFNMHRKYWDKDPAKSKISESQHEVGEAGWRVLHEAGIIDYRSDHAVPDISIPIIDTIREQITQRLIEHDITINRSNRLHRPPVATGTAAGLAELSGQSGEGTPADAVSKPTTDGDAQGRLLEEGRRYPGAERGAVPGLAAPKTELTDQGEQFVLPGAERSDKQALAARAAQERIKPKAKQKEPGGLFDQPAPETGGTLARLMADESGAVPLPDWNKIKAYFNIGRKKAQTAREIAMEGVRMRLGAPDTLRSLSKMARYLRSAVSLAAIDRPSSVYWNAILRRDHTRATLEREAVDQVRPYLALEPQARARIDKVLEHDRLYGIDRKYTGRDVVVKIPDRKAPFGEGRPELSKPGEIVALDTKETQALQQLRKFFDQRLMQMGEAMAVERGYRGKFDRASIEKAIADAGSPRERRPAQAALEVLERTEEMRRMGYVPFQRYGDTYITIKPKTPESGIMPPEDGKTETAWFEMLDTKSVLDSVFSQPGGTPRRALADRIAELKKRFPPDRFTYQTGDVTPKAIAELNIPAIERAFAALNAKQGKGSAEIIDGLMHQIYEARKAGLKRQSENVPGYSTDFERAITDYVRQTSAIVARMSHRQDVDSAYDATQAHPVKEVREYWAKHKEHTESEGGDYAGLRKLGFFMFLWGSPASAVINLTQTPLVTQMQLGTWAGIRAPILSHSAMLEGLSAIRVGRNGLELDFDTIGKTDAERSMLKALRDDGRFDPAISQDMQGANLSTRPAVRPHLKRLQRVYEIGASGFNVTEQVNRVAAALAYFRAAQNPQLRDKMREVYKNDENFKEMVARRGMNPVDIARYGVDETQFIGGKINRMPVMRGWGAVMLQFKTYIANYLRLMHKNFTRMGPQGKIAGSIMLLSLLAISGLFGLPFGDDALQAADFLAEKATGIDPNLEFQLRQMVADAGFGEYGAEVMTRGFGRNLFGVDIGGRIGMGNIFPDDSITSLAPLITGTFARVSEATDRLHSGQPMGAMAALAGAFIGKGGQDIVKGTVVYPNEGVSTKRGNWTVLPDDVSLADMTIRSLGFQPTKVTRKSEAQYQAGRIANATQDARTAMLTQIARLVVMGMDAREAGDTESAEEYSRQVQALYESNAASLLDPTIPDWQKIKPAQRAAVKARVMSLIKPEIANIRRAGKMTRPTLLETPFVGEP